MDQTSQTFIDVPPTMWTRFCVVRNRVTFVGDRARLFGTRAPMLRVVNANFWLLLLLLLLQPPFGTFRQFLIILGNPKYRFLVRLSYCRQWCALPRRACANASGR